MLFCLEINVCLYHDFVYWGGWWKKLILAHEHRHMNIGSAQKGFSSINCGKSPATIINYKQSLLLICGSQECPENYIQSVMFLSISHGMHSFVLDKNIKTKQHKTRTKQKTHNHKQTNKQTVCSILCLCSKWPKLTDLVPNHWCRHEDGLVQEYGLLL